MNSGLYQFAIGKKIQSLTCGAINEFTVQVDPAMKAKIVAEAHYFAKRSSVLVKTKYNKEQQLLKVWRED